MEQIRVGLLGAGRIGQIHAGNLAQHCPGAQLVWVADALENAAQQTAGKYGAQWTTDPRKVLEDKSVKAVLICSPTDQHARQIREVAEAGKDIFCEKPIDFDLGRIDEALAAVSRAKVRLQMGFNRRFDPSFAKARELIQKGRIGTPHLVRITSRDPKPPPPDYVKASGGLFADMTIHDFDMARWIAGDEVDEVFAFAGNLVDPEIQKLGDIDTAIVSLKYRSGALGAIDNSRRATYGYDQRVEVFGSKGCVAVGNRAPTQVTVSEETGIQGDLPQYFFLERYEEAYRAEMKHFVECVREKKQPSVTGADGRAPIVLAKAASLSVKERRSVKIEKGDKS